MSANNQNTEKSKKYLIYVAVIICISVYSVFTGDIMQTMISAAFGGGFFASLCMAKKKVLYILPTVIIPPAFAFAFTGEAEWILLSLSFLPVGIAVCWGIKKRLSRSATVVCGIGGLCTVYLPLYLYYVYEVFGAIDSQSIMKYVDLNFELFRRFTENMKQMYINNGVDAEKYFSAELIDDVIESMSLSWLGYSLAFFGILSFVASMIAKALTKTEFPAELGNWRYVFSKQGAFVFIACFIANGLFSAETEGNYLPFALNTICIGMYPALVYMGVSKLVQKLKAHQGMKYLIIFLIGLSIFGQYLLLLLIVLGIQATLTEKSQDIKNTAKKI